MDNTAQYRAWHHQTTMSTKVRRQHFAAWPSRHEVVAWPWATVGTRAGRGAVMANARAGVMQRASHTQTNNP